jgi:hypothetical protein
VLTCLQDADVFIRQVVDQTVRFVDAAAPGAGDDVSAAHRPIEVGTSASADAE